MKRDYIEEVSGRIETTIGDLVEALTEFAMQTGQPEQECYELATLALEEVLKENHAERYVKLPSLQ